MQNKFGKLIRKGKINKTVFDKNWKFTIYPFKCSFIWWMIILIPYLVHKGGGWSLMVSVPVSYWSDPDRLKNLISIKAKIPDPEPPSSATLYLSKSVVHPNNLGPSIFTENTGCSLNIVLYSGLCPFSVCVYTSRLGRQMAGRTPAFQQDWQSVEKSQHFKENQKKETILNEHPVDDAHSSYLCSNRFYFCWPRWSQFKNLVF